MSFLQTFCWPPHPMPPLKIESQKNLPKTILRFVSQYFQNKYQNLLIQGLTAPLCPFGQILYFNFFSEDLPIDYVLIIINKKQFGYYGCPYFNLIDDYPNSLTLSDPTLFRWWQTCRPVRLELFHHLLHGYMIILLSTPGPGWQWAI